MQLILLFYLLGPQKHYRPRYSTVCKPPGLDKEVLVSKIEAVDDFTLLTKALISEMALDPFSRLFSCSRYTS